MHVTEKALTAQILAQKDPQRLEKLELEAAAAPKANMNGTAVAGSWQPHIRPPMASALREQMISEAMTFHATFSDAGMLFKPYSPKQAPS